MNASLTGAVPTTSQKSSNSFEIEAQIVRKQESRGMWMSGYLKSLQIRLLFNSILVGASIVVLTLGTCMSAFARVRRSGVQYEDFVVAFVGVPMFFILMTFLLDNIVALVWELTDVPRQPLISLRSTCVGFGVRYRSVILGLLTVCEALPLLWTACECAIQQDFRVAALINMYSRGYVITCVVLAVSLLLCKVSIAFTRCTSDDVKQRVAAAKKQLVEHDFFDLSFTLQASTDRHVAELYASNKRLCLTCLGIAGVLIVVGYACFQLTEQIVIAFAVLLAILFLQWKALLAVAPKLFGKTYLVMLCLYAFFSIASMPFDVANINAEGSKFVFLQSGLYARQSEVPIGEAAYNAYPICSMRWGRGTKNDGLQLNIFDFLVLANSVYRTSPVDVYDHVNNATLNTAYAGFRLEEIQPHLGVARYAVFNFPAAKKRVLAIRGTQQKSDMLADIEMLSPVIMLNTISQLIPIDRLIARSTWRWYFSTLDISKWFGGRPTPYARHLERAIELKRQCDEEGYELFVTGHSLGGILAAIIGAHLNVKSVAFSPPGQEFMLNQYGLNKNVQISRTLTAVKPERDVVPEIDGQIGNIQPIACSAGFFGLCHLNEITFCELFKRCGGDPRGRQRPELMADFCKVLWSGGNVLSLY
eukprot:TRINITY_DN2333_c0_g1_i3.p1 TRINITY_DN2333_c0_g1~~TRINITY_DN2333_c0_g1_i3.p1  ORF type:complete len:672 (-),score=81.22 TRINITY_DN2333_c0_g1_i3:66-2000(-)